MRNEILADYGYRFTAEADVAQFQYADWYQPQYDTVQECEERMTAVDLQNLQFLDRMIMQIGNKPA